MTENMNGIVEMHLAEQPFEMISSGEKTVEIRLFDEKRRALKLGDVIVFYKGEGKTESVTAQVAGLFRFDGFEELFDSALFGKTGCGNMTVTEAVQFMHGFYSPQKERELGVLAIEIKLL